MFIHFLTALDVTASDTKALFRREQAHEELGQYSQAYNDARRLLQIEPKNKTFQKIAFKLRQILEVKVYVLPCYRIGTNTNHVQCVGEN